MRATAIIIFVISAFYVGFGVHGFWNADRQGRFVARVGEAYGQRIDAQDWTRHWRTGSIEFLVAGILFGIAATGLWRRRPSALILFAATLVAQLAWDLGRYIAGYSAYAFERPEPLGVTITSVAATAAVFMFLRLRRNATPVADA